MSFAAGKAGGSNEQTHPCRTSALASNTSTIAAIMSLASKSVDLALRVNDLCLVCIFSLQWVPPVPLHLYLPLPSGIAPRPRTILSADRVPSCFSDPLVAILVDVRSFWTAQSGNTALYREIMGL
ncbi:hypothetical protein RJ035_003082 [Blastomyces gilchristii]